MGCKLCGPGEEQLRYCLLSLAAPAAPSCISLSVLCLLAKQYGWLSISKHEVSGCIRSRSIFSVHVKIDVSWRANHIFLCALKPPWLHWEICLNKAFCVNFKAVKLQKMVWFILVASPDSKIIIISVIISGIFLQLTSCRRWMGKDLWCFLYFSQYISSYHDNSCPSLPLK